MPLSRSARPAGKRHRSRPAAVLGSSARRDDVRAEQYVHSSGSGSAGQIVGGSWEWRELGPIGCAKPSGSRSWPALDAPGVHSSEAAPAWTRLWEWRLDGTTRKVVGSRSLYPDRVDDRFVGQRKSLQCSEARLRLRG
jgi:hypothetical protein